MEILRERLLCAKVLKDLGFLDSSTYEGFKSAVDLAQSNKYDNVSVDQLIRSMGEKLKASVTPAELPAMQERIKHLEFMNTSEGLDSAKQAEILYLQEQLGKLKREKDDTELNMALQFADTEHGLKKAQELLERKNAELLADITRKDADILSKGEVITHITEERDRLINLIASGADPTNARIIELEKEIKNNEQKIQQLIAEKAAAAATATAAATAVASTKTISNLEIEIGKLQLQNKALTDQITKQKQEDDKKIKAAELTIQTLERNLQDEQKKLRESIAERKNLLDQIDDLNAKLSGSGAATTAALAKVATHAAVAAAAAPLLGTIPPPPPMSAGISPPPSSMMVSLRSAIDADALKSVKLKSPEPSLKPAAKGVDMAALMHEAAMRVNSKAGNPSSVKSGSKVEEKKEKKTTINMQGYKKPIYRINYPKLAEYEDNGTYDSMDDDEYMNELKLLGLTKDDFMDVSNGGPIEYQLVMHLKELNNNQPACISYFLGLIDQANKRKQRTGGSYSYDYSYNTISGGALPDNYIYLILVIIVLILILLFMSSKPVYTNRNHSRNIMTCSA